MAVNRTFIGNIKGKQGDKGATGAKIISQVLQGQDENGGYIYLQTYDDGTTQTFVAPRGATGEMGLAGADGKTPFIGENGNWFIGEQDTGVKAQGKDGANGKDGTNGVDGQNGVGISEVVSGESYVEGENTVTPITFKKTDGSENIVNVIAKNGVGGEGGTTNLLSEPIIISNKLSDDTFEKEVNNFGLELGKEYTSVFYGTSTDFPYEGQPSVFTDVGAHYLPYELPSGSYILEQFTGAISVFIYVNAKKENGVLVYNEGTTFIKVLDSYSENEITFESIMEAKPEYATVDSLNEVNGKVLSLEQGLKEVTQENVLGTIDIYPNENSQLIRNIDALNIKLNTEYTVKFITWGIGTEELTLSAFAQTGSEAGMDNDESYVLTFSFNNGQLIIFDKSKNVDGVIVYDENSAVIQCQGNDISEVTLLSLTAPKSFASKEEVEALGEEVDMLKIGEPLVATFQIMSANTQVTAQYMQGTKYIDWGDGTNIEAIDYSVTKVFTHTYEKTGMFNAKFYGMTSMNGNCFDNQTRLRYVVIPETITGTGSYSFRGCTNLSSVSLPQNLSSIGERAFYGCSALAHINLENITVINDTAFGQCKKLETIKVDRRCSVWGNAFSGATALKTARFNNGASFYGGVFNGCTALKTVTVAGDMSTSQYGNDLITTAKLIVPYDQLESYKTDEQWSKMASQIDSYALASELENIGGSSTPSGEPLVATFNITTDNTNAQCKNIVGATLVDWGDGSALEDISSVTTYSHTYTTKGKYEVTFYGNITSIGKEAFAKVWATDVPILYSISMPDTIRTLGDRIFSGCTSLVSVKISNSIRTLPSDMCYNCSLLKSINLPACLEKINANGFNGCSSLPYIDIPSGVNWIGSKAFYGCSNLAYIEFHSAPASTMADYNHFSSNTKLIVPYKYVERYKTADKWFNYADQIDTYAFASDIGNINTELTNIIEGEGV